MKLDNKTIAILALIAVVVALILVLVFGSGFNVNKEKEIELKAKIEVLETQRSELIKRAIAAESKAKQFEQLAKLIENNRTETKRDYHEKSNRVYDMPFAARRSAFTDQLNRLDSIVRQ